MDSLSQILAVFSGLSLLAVGGGTAVIPEMQHLLHDYLGVSHLQFVHAYSIGQIAPGPNMLSVIIMGEMADGLWGGVVAGLAFFIPSSLLCFFAGRLWEKAGDSPWRLALQNALQPITLGLMFAGCYVISKEALVSWKSALLGVAVLLLLLKTKFSPITLICAAGLISLGMALMN